MLYALVRLILKTNSRCCLRRDYIGCISSSDFYPLLRHFSWQYRHYQRGCMYVAVSIMLQALNYPQWFTRFPTVHLVTQVPKGLPSIYTRADALTQQCSATQSVAPTPVIGGIRLCLSVLLVVNIFTIIQRKGKRKT